MRRVNAVTQGIKQHGDPRAYYESLKVRAAAGGMTAIEWEWYHARQKQWEPEAYEKYLAEVDRSIAMDRARTLSIADLETLIAEKCAEQTS